jgi:hypothetical protein
MAQPLGLDQKVVESGDGCGEIPSENCGRQNIGKNMRITMEMKEEITPLHGDLEVWEW